jgi:hypothetical protein
LGPLFLKGKQQGELALLCRQIEKRFGHLPEWASERIAGLPTDELEELGVKIFDARTLEEFLH